MPRLSDSMEEGTIIRWLKSDGDEVRRGDEIVEIETDKANMTYEADQDGVLQIVAREGDTLPIGEVIARIGGNGSAPSPAPREAPAPAEADGGAAERAPAAEETAREERTEAAAAAGTAATAEAPPAGGDGDG